MEHRTKTATLKLLEYCQANNWAGYDPYDALNSRLFRAFPLLDSRIPRLVLTQLLKRSPVNLRPALLVPKTQNPKGLALFLKSVLTFSDIGEGDHRKAVDYLLGRIVELRSSGYSCWCWGYSFPWQTRTLTVPVGAPNLVCTTFVAGALLDAYERGQDKRYLAMAASSCDYLLSELYWTDGPSAAGFSYPMPGLRVQIHNANFLAAALLSRVSRHTGNTGLLDIALRVARCAAAAQEANGSWAYGEGGPRRWVDNFHTGYNLCALREIARCTETDEFEPAIRRGFDFYRAHFFRSDGAPRYFHNATYPIDIHSVAQSIITLLSFSDLDQDNAALADSVFNWAMRNMWDDDGFFYYRVLRTLTIRTSYMRWSQAWMLLALSTLLAHKTSSASNSLCAEAMPRD